jgi:hypothetical protein
MKRVAVLPIGGWIISVAVLLKKIQMKFNGRICTSGVERNKRLTPICA